MTIFFISDLHFGHQNIIRFTYKDGSRLRNFDTVEEHDEFLIESINRVVKPTDRLIIVGDCVVNKKYMPQVGRLNGRKTLVMGNHDPLDWNHVTPYFEKIAGALSVDSFIATHIPVHVNQLQNRFKGNIHGHLHGLPVMEANGVFRDTRYFNVSVESLKYTPVSLEQIKEQVLL